MPTNTSGYVLTIGPDVDGKFFDVADGEDYTLPAPSRTVTDDEADAAEQAAKDAAKTSRKAKPTTPDDSTEGVSA